MPTFDDLAAWAGADCVTRAQPETLEHWRLAAADKAMLVHTGIPQVDQLIETAFLQTEPEPALHTASGRLLYRLTENHHGNTVPGLTWSFGVEPETGTVYYVLPDGEDWFANTSIDLWLRTLHHYGRYVHQSPTLSDPDPNEDKALAELRELADQLRHIDPPAFDGYLGYIWAEFLERWLW